MPFEFSPQKLAGVVLVRPGTHSDARGTLRETYRFSEFRDAGIATPFVQDNHSTSTRGVLRGIHYQLPPRAQGKLVWVVEGTIWDVCVDLRKRSKTFGKWFGATLSAENQQMLYLPPGCGHGFVVQSDRAQVIYKCTQEYDPQAERGVRYDDPTLAIQWPLREVTLSAKDAGLPSLSDAPVFEMASL